MESEQLTSTTAPGKLFASRTEIADHYKSDWHKYNLKRREAGLPLLLETDFQARLAAALSLRQEEGRHGTSHLKKGKKHKNKKNKQNDVAPAINGAVMKSQTSAYDKIKEENNADGVEVPVVENAMETEEGESGEQAVEEEEEAPVIDPKQCLFDPHFSASVEANADRMYRKYGFFLPDREYLTDLEGLIGYCHEKIKLGHMCVCCHKVFQTWQGCQKHMISKTHTKLKYEAGVDLEDLSVFYDFSEADNEFMKSVAARASKRVVSESKDNDDTIMEDDGDANWEDISDDEDMGEDGEDGNDDDDGIYDQYESHLAQYGFDVNVLGELILPNGRVIGHRALQRYYKQRVPNTNSSSALVAARRAAGERLFNGAVVNIHGLNENSMALTKAGINPDMAAGRKGKGILHKNKGGVYSSLSIYRFRASVRKQRREDDQGKRIYEHTSQNMNRMDKKANRLHNNVSVAHAKR